MPDTIEQLGILTVMIALAIIAFTVMQRRRTDDDPTDALIVLWRRWAARGKLELPRGESAAVALAESPAEPAVPARPKPKVLLERESAAARAKARPTRAKPAPGTSRAAKGGARPKAVAKPKAAAKSKAAAKPKAKKPASSKKGTPVRPPEVVADVEATPVAATVLNQGPEEPPMSDPQQPQDEQTRDDEPSAEAEPRRRRFLRRRRGEPVTAPGEPPSATSPSPTTEPAPPADAPTGPPATIEPPAGPPTAAAHPPTETEAAATEPEPEPVVGAEPSEGSAPQDDADAPALSRRERREQRRAEAAAATTTPPPVASDADHVPLATAEERQRSGEPKILLRQRFRRGLRRTRERLGAEMREAFTGGATPEAFDRLEEALVAADVGVATTAALVDDLRERIGLSDTTLPRELRDVMVKQLSEADRRLHLVRGKVSVWVIVGVNGTGKTTTIAKLGARARDLGLPVALAAADTFRAAAVEQLSEWGRRLGVEVIKQDQGADPGAVVFDALAHARATGKRLLIVDTAGRLHTRKPLMDELQKVFRVIERDESAVIAETLLVIDATTGQNGISQAKAFKDAVPVSGLALAKLDGSAKGGITFAVERELGVPVKAVGVGESEKDLIPFDAESFVDALVGED